MQFKNTENRYGIIAYSFHWIMALIIIGMLTVGLYMKSLPIGAQKLKLYGLHKEFGILVLMLVTARLLWRWSHIVPSLAQLPLWERLAARSVHGLLYFFMFAMPLTGWLVTSAAGLPISFFGIFVVPTLVPANQEQLHLFATIHEVLAFSLIAVICLHVGAALKHLIIDKDDIFQRML